MLSIEKTIMVFLNPSPLGRGKRRSRREREAAKPQGEGIPNALQNHQTLGVLGSWWFLKNETRRNREAEKKRNFVSSFLRVKPTPLSSLRGVSATTQSRCSNGSPRALQSLAMTGRGLKTFFSREVSKNRRKNTIHSICNPVPDTGSLTPLPPNSWCLGVLVV